jgi:AsnC-like helix-turn-helix protein
MVAYILVHTEVGVIGDVAGEIAAIKGVMSADAVTGPYDVIARAEADSLDARPPGDPAHPVGGRREPHPDLPGPSQIAKGPPLRRRALESTEDRYAMGRTFAAWAPSALGHVELDLPVLVEALVASPWMALKCTKTSSPS